MNEKPVSTALLPNTGVTNLRFRRFAIFRLFGKVHRDGGPSQRATAGDLQVFSRGQTAAGHIGEEFLLYSVAVFLPAMVGKWREVVKNEAIILRVVFGWRVGIA